MITLLELMNEAWDQADRMRSILSAVSVKGQRLDFNKRKEKVSKMSSVNFFSDADGIPG